MKVSEIPKEKDRDEFTARVIMSLADDVAALKEATDRIATQVTTLALEHEVAV